MGKLVRNSKRELGKVASCGKLEHALICGGGSCVGGREKVMVTYKTDLAVRLWAGREPGGFVKKTALAGKSPRGYTRGSS